MNVLLLQIDGERPNLALMRIAAHHRAIGDEVTLRRADHVSRVPAHFGDSFDQVYASAIFEWSRPICEEVLRQWPGAVIGGSGWDPDATLPKIGITTLATDYSDYPGCDYSMGFVFRGCRKNCSFCLVPQMEGRVRPEQTIPEIYRGGSHARRLLLLDNDFGGHSTWRDRAREIIDGQYRVSFFQGINARLMFEELAETLCAMDLRDDNFKKRQFYTAWDSQGDEAVLFRGLGWLTKYGLKPDHIMVYMLCGYCHRHEQAAYRCPASCRDADTFESREYRRKRLRDFGARPFPMAFLDDGTPEHERAALKGFQRWVIRREDFNMPWEKFMGANYRPERVHSDPPAFPLFEANSLIPDHATGGHLESLPKGYHNESKAT